MLRSRDVLLKFGCRHSDATHPPSHASAAKRHNAPSPHNYEPLRVTATSYQLYCLYLCVRPVQIIHSAPHTARAAEGRLDFKTCQNPRCHAAVRAGRRNLYPPPPVSRHTQPRRTTRYSRVPRQLYAADNTVNIEMSAPEGNRTVVQLNGNETNSRYKAILEFDYFHPVVYM